VREALGWVDIVCWFGFGVATLGIAAEKLLAFLHDVLRH
jgi:hypothetical protein